MLLSKNLPGVKKQKNLKYIKNKNMIRLTVMYPNKADLKFNKEYYVNQHSKLLSNLLGSAIITSDINFGIASGEPDKPAPFAVITNLVFESLEIFQNSFGVNAEKIQADLLNFTNVKPVVQISEIV